MVVHRRNNLWALAGGDLDNDCQWHQRVQFAMDHEVHEILESRLKECTNNIDFTLLTLSCESCKWTSLSDHCTHMCFRFLNPMVRHPLVVYYRVGTMITMRVAKVQQSDRVPLRTLMINTRANRLGMHR